MDLKHLSTNGELFESGSALIFFGNTNFDLSNPAITENHYSLLNQEHGDILVKAATEVQTADAQWTDQKNLPLVIGTADCLPVLISIDGGDRILAIHAGWRGVANEIVINSLSYLNDIKPLTSIQCWIGPHIQQKSFAVDKDVFTQLIPNDGKAANELYTQSCGKYYPALSKIIIQQINRLNINTDILISSADTKTDSNFYSFREDQGSSRNLSFILKE